MNKFERRSNASYNKKAENYDSTYDGKFTVKFKKLLSETMTVKEGAVVADIGCGNGRFLKEMSEKYTFSGVGVDIAENMIECAKNLNPDMKFFVGKCDALPLADSSVDIMTVCAAFHHFPDAGKFADEASRTIKRGGMLYIADVYMPAVLRAIINPFIGFSAAGDVKIYSPKEISRLFSSRGFTPTETKIDGKVQIVALKKI